MESFSRILESFWGKVMLIGAAAVVWLVIHGFRLWDRIRLRHIPQVPFCAGNFLLGHSAEYRKEEPYLLYERWMHQLGGIFLIFNGKRPVVVLSDPESIRQASVANFKSFRNRPSFMPSGTKDKRIGSIQAGLMVAQGGYWSSLRAAMQPLFHTSALHSYSPIFNEAARKLAAKLQAVGEGGKPVELHSLLGEMTMGVIGESAFGVKLSMDGADADLAAGTPNLGAALKIILSTNLLLTAPGFVGALIGIIPSWLEPLVFKAFLSVVQYGRQLDWAYSTVMSTTDQLIGNALRRAAQEGRKLSVRLTDWQWWGEGWAARNPYKDATPSQNSVVEMLMRATNKETGDGLSDMQIGAQCNNLIGAGYETTANSLAFIIFLLASNPRAQQDLVAEVDAFGMSKVPGLDDLDKFPYTDAVIRETLRMFPPAWNTPRQANEDAVVGGRLIPRGTQVHLNIYGLHHHPSHWPKPHTFRPERFLEEGEVQGRHPNAWAPFGVGPRMCIGYRFAMQQMALVLIRLYQQYTFQLSPAHHPKGSPLKIRTSMTLGPAQGVWVTVHPR